ncbi:conserved hypothetical protein [Methylobacterium sp. 4-46]|uniref:hypothetical protein n=1 Tax=unclassified Methylobacterium TaxID=2615210 RepID=UPI000165C8CC|nr:MULTISPECIES: hypothetical protein [Methylobacterium]ACA14775.1 conserved hypothetical protein [Methylobacterium sp. 4-46]WFT80525.1 hypothetical protein QA634_01020 [Methylobacterium nodulans]
MIFSGRTLVAALVPLAAALAAVGLAALTGFSQARAEAAGYGAWVYGFFLDQFPLYAVAIIYGVARILAVTAEALDRSAARRLAGAVLGTALLLGLSLYPTFGGAVLRAGFMVGGMSFLNGVPLAAARALGALAALLPFGAGLALAGLVGGRRRKPGWLPALAARALALWWALGLLGLGRAAGLAAWPQRPLDGAQALLAAGLVLAAFLPHAVLAGLRRPG